MKLDKRLIFEINEKVQTFDTKGKYGRKAWSNISPGFSGEDNIRIEDWGEFIEEEIVRIFLRLTQYPENSLIPIYDLITKDHPFLIEQATTSFGNPAKFTTRNDYILGAINLILEWIDFCLRKIQQDTALPTRYLPEMKAFEMKSDTTNMILQLESLFKEFREVKEAKV